MAAYAPSRGEIVWLSFDPSAAILLRDENMGARLAASFHRKGWSDLIIGLP